MKVVMTLLVRNEEDILRENLEFHLARGVDEIILMDNLSEDGTAEIAREYERAGCLRYLFQPRDDYSQGRWVTHMARLAVAEHHADWVINNDADEFWYPHAGTIKDALAGIGGRARAASAERTNFITRLPNGQPFWRRMDARHLVTFNSRGQPLPVKVAHRAIENVVVEQGSHRVRAGRRRVRSERAPITILHFPVRSRVQFFRKIALGGAAYARNTDLAPSVGATWRHLYELYLRGELDRAFEKELRTDEEVAAGVAAGELVRDGRLLSALAVRAATPAYGRAG